MAVNFPNSPINGEQFTANGVTYQWNSTTNLWEISLVTVPTDVNELTDESALLVGGGGQGVTAYTNMSDLPMTGNSTGAMAFITSTNGLFIWNGATWYGVTVQSNTGPTISSVQDGNSGTAPFTLSTLGAATVVTVTATDPEGAPLTYSYSVTSGSLTNGGGTTATVTQNGNVFTVTPTTTEDYQGTFELTFTASDGELSDTSAASFTLQFATPLQADTQGNTLLLTTSGSAGDNSVFTDSSSNALTITSAGTPSSQSFSPYRAGGYSVRLDGSTGWIDTGVSDNFGTGDVTFECWVKTSGGGIMLAKYQGGSVMEAFQIATTNGIMASHTASGTEGTIGTKDLRDNQWHHLVFERYNGTYYYYADGELQGTVANTENAAVGGNWIVGKHGTADIEWYDGEIRDLKLTVGTAVYSGTTPAVPTEPVSVDGTETLVLFTGIPYGKDLSPNNGTFTATGGVTFVPEGPYDVEIYDNTKHGGSVYMNGSGDYLAATHNGNFNFGTGDFTIDFWYYPTAHKNWSELFDTRNSASTAGGMAIYTNASGTVLVYSSDGSSGSNNITGDNLVLNQWSHIEVSRSSGSTKLFINGKQSGSTYTDGNDYTGPSAAPRIGADQSGQYTAAGYISDFRILNGTAAHTADFTPPTEPQSSVGAAVHIVGTDANIYDATQTVNPVTLVGNATASTTQTKYLSSSMYFDGTGDYIDTGKNLHANFGTGDFTVEAWVYLDETIGSNRAIFGSGTSDGNDEFTLLLLSNGSFYFDWGDTSTQYIQQAGATFTANAWHHVAVTRSGTQLDIWLDGTSVVSNTSHSFNYAGTSTFKIGMARNGGMYWKGYIEDVRVTNGLARYTEDFTVPTESLLTYTPPPAAAGASSFTFTGGDWTGTSTNAFTYSSNVIRNTSGASYSDGIQNGKVYFEVDLTSISNVAMGLYPSSLTDFGFTTAGGAAIDSTTGDVYPGPIDENATITNGSVLMFAADATAQKVWIGVNGTWTTATGDPATGSGISTSGASGETYVFAAMSTTGGLFSGTAEATILTSGGLNYTVPTGFSALADVPDNIAWGGDKAVIQYGSNLGTGALSTFDITTLGQTATFFGTMNQGRHYNAALSDTTYGVWGGGYVDDTTQYVNTIDYVTIATNGSKADFGDLATGTYAERSGTACDGTRGLFISGFSNSNRAIDYITVASPGNNATSWGDLTTNGFYTSAVSGDTYAIVHLNNTFDVLTIQTTGSATNFGNTLNSLNRRASFSDKTYGVFCGGEGTSNYNFNIDYITMGTSGTASEFGSLERALRDAAGLGNNTRGCICHGQNNSQSENTNIEYVTIAAPGNAQDFGDLAGATGSRRDGTSGNAA